MTNRAWSVGEVDLGTLTSKGERLRRTKSILINTRQKKRLNAIPCGSLQGCACLLVAIACKE